MQNFLNKLIALLDSKDFKAVVQSCRFALNQSNHPQIHLFLAIAEGELGNYRSASEIFENLASHFPQNPEIVYNFGIIQEKNGFPKLAIKSYEKCLVINPRHELANNNLGKIYLNLKRFEQAHHYLHQATVLNPNNPLFAKNLAYCYFQSSQDNKARTLFEKIFNTTLFEENDFINYCHILHKQDAHTQIVESGKAFLKKLPQSHQAMTLMGQALLELKQVPKAIIYLKKALEISADLKAPLYNLALAYSLLGNEAELQGTIIKIKAFSDLDSFLFLATLYENNNQTSEANDIIEQALLSHPENKELQLIQIKILNSNKQYQKSLEQINTLLQETKNPIKSKFLFEKAMVLDKLNRPEDAWVTAQEANDLKLQDWQRNHTQKDQYIQKCHAICSSTITTPIVPSNNNRGNDLVFIFGFMRSGTTLLDSILSAHSNTVILEEMPLIKNIFSEFSSEKPEDYFKNVLELNANEALKQSLAEKYYASINDYIDWQKGQIIVDKSPINTSLIAFVKTVFPAAKIVFSVRHPLDVSVSCFFQDFKENSFMSNMTSITHIAQTYDAMLSVWKKSLEVFNIEVYYQSYESLVSEFESQTRKIVVYLGLGWQDPLLNYQESLAKRGSITTPSYNQVNQAIYQTAKNRHEKYLPHLSEATQILKPWIEFLEYKSAN